MKKSVFTALLALLLLVGCAPAGTLAPAEGEITVVATTYPIYLFANAVAEGAEGVRVERLDTGSTSCLHDYTLSVSDMRKLEGADAVALNGAGLEEFMEDALAASDAAVIDCSEGVELLENLSHRHEEGEDHDHGHWDPHYWMDPANAQIMVENLAQELSRLDPEQAERYQANGRNVCGMLEEIDVQAREMLQKWEQPGAVLPGTGGGPLSIPGLITFHDGFQYFAKAYSLPLLAAIEEEAGSEASAKEIVEITELVREYKLPVIFTEVNGSEATAGVVARETGCRVAQLSMLMDGPDSALSNYSDGLLNNVCAVINGFAGQEVAKRP